MFKKHFFNLAVSLATALLLPSNVVAETLVNAQDIYPRSCHVKIDNWEQKCEWITIGLLSDYSAFNIKLCSSGYRCLILIGEANELQYYPYSMRIYSVAWQEGTRITKRWSGNLVFGSYYNGHGVVGTLEGSVIAAYFE